MGPPATFSFETLGDTAFAVAFGPDITPQTNARVQALHRSVKAARVKGVLETQPSFRSLLVVYDPCLTTRGELEPVIAGLAAKDVEAAKEAGRLWRLPVCYDSAFAPDQKAAAAALGLTADRLIALHAGAEYGVYMLGFLPGFAYLGDLPLELRLPRLAHPRTSVPAGSVALAQQLTAIYPWESPGGWHVIGRCAVPLFSPWNDPPALLAPGERVRFLPVGSLDHETLARSVADGSFDPRRLL
jgi:inhibitor of KinA